MFLLAAQRPGTQLHQTGLTVSSGTAALAAIVPWIDWTRLLGVGCRALLGGALDDTAACATDLRKRFPKYKSRGAQKQDRDGDTDDDIWPERLGPGY